jgi:hypothetical protein
MAVPDDGFLTLDAAVLGRARWSGRLDERSSRSLRSRKGRRLPDASSSGSGVVVDRMTAAPAIRLMAIGGPTQV